MLEEFASGPSIAKRFAKAGGDENIGEPSPANSAEEVFRAASGGNKAAAEILTSAGEALGVSTAFLVNVLDPEMIVVGGGLGLAGGLYWDSFQQSCREHIFAADARSLPIVTAKLGTDAGLVGAAAVVFVQQNICKGSYAHGTD